MSRGYTRKQMIDKLEEASQKMHLFYKKSFVNYLGKTIDTEEDYTEVISDWLLQNISCLDNIPNITRTTSYATKSHDGIPKNGLSNRDEELIAMTMFRQKEFDKIGQIIDYQIPLKNERQDKAGKIDLLSYDGSVARILELKEPDSMETMLRCVLEGYTYLKTVDKEKLLQDFKLPQDTVLVASPLVFWGSNQYWQMTGKNNNKLKQLMYCLNSEPFYVETVAEFEKYKIVQGGL